MIVSINQPAYMPWLGYFDRVAKSDMHIVLDNVQFEKNSVTNRNKLRTPSGWTWFSVPILKKGRFGELEINKVEVETSKPWRKKHFGTLTANYARAPFYSKYVDFFEDFYSQNWKFLNPMLEKSTEYFTQELGIDTEHVSSSKFSIESKKSQLILDLCREVGATTYLSGPFGREYLDEQEFKDAGIELEFHDYVHPYYKQNFDGFEPYMSIVDLLFNHGEESLEILRS